MPRDAPPDDLPVIVAEWPRNTRERVRVGLSRYNGHAVVDVRCWYPAGDGELRPGKSGLTLGVGHLPRLADAFAKAMAEAVRRGLVADPDADAGRS